ncbi:MAG: efflux RND transporter periplasmic adaptor subunit [Dehalococcoidales bacterium]|nr:efflux RND transporter periplasmic adaptor subunit [Dehalococcoidales bacterium]
MKRKLLVGLIFSIAVLALLGTTACDFGGGQSTVSQQQVEVTRGDLTLSVTGNGKMETSREARLTFGSAGKVDRILVAEGDRVMTGDVLASLDTSTLELAVNQAQMALTQVEVALTQAQLAEETADYNLENTRNSEDSLNLALLNAQIALDTARANLNAGITAVDFNSIVAELNKAQTWYDSVKIMAQDTSRTSIDWDLTLLNAQENLDIAQANYDNALAGYDSRQVNLMKKQVEAAELSVVLAQKNIDDLDKSVALQELQLFSAEQAVMQAEQAVELARQNLADVQRQLDEATITAPFEGVVAVVLAEEGDIIPSPSMAPTTIIQMINPGYLELVIEVDEIDIPLVELGQKAAVSVDALPDKEFEGIVTAVYPVPMEVGGVVLYKVKIGLENTDDSGIKVGMSASADIVAEKHENVLMVPSRAITKNDRGQTIVKVMVDNQAQEREVVVGLDDGFRAEIVSGVSEGETVIYEIRVKSPSMSMF